MFHFSIWWKPVSTMEWKKIKVIATFHLIVQTLFEIFYSDKSELWDKK